MTEFGYLVAGLILRNGLRKTVPKESLDDEYDGL